jgi:hypothetical protein
LTGEAGNFLPLKAQALPAFKLLELVWVVHLQEPALQLAVFVGLLEVGNHLRRQIRLLVPF